MTICIELPLKWKYNCEKCCLCQGEKTDKVVGNTALQYRAKWIFNDFFKYSTPSSHQSDANEARSSTIRWGLRHRGDIKKTQWIIYHRSCRLLFNNAKLEWTKEMWIQSQTLCSSLNASCVKRLPIYNETCHDNEAQPKTAPVCAYPESRKTSSKAELRWCDCTCAYVSCSLFDFCNRYTTAIKHIWHINLSLCSRSIELCHFSFASERFAWLLKII